jgi:hypothetical protein
LDKQYQTALKSGDWEAAAEYLNRFNTEDIKSRLEVLNKSQIANLYDGAFKNPRVGSRSNVAQMTEARLSTDKVYDLGYHDGFDGRVAARYTDPDYNAAYQKGYATGESDKKSGNVTPPPLNTPPTSEHFKIKMMEAVQFGEIGGALTITFAIWDIDNNWGAVYEYIAPIATVGTPFTWTREGDWSGVFKTYWPGVP